MSIIPPEIALLKERSPRPTPYLCSVQVGISLILGEALGSSFGFAFQAPLRLQLRVT
jgi:hypothetical protein